MKSMLKNKKIAIGSILVVFLLFNIFAISNVLAATFQEEAVFNLDKKDPEGYGAIVPSPNTLGAAFVDGANQGKFTVTNWLATTTYGEEIISYPGEDISLYYPTDLDNYWTGAMSLTDDIDPWSEVHWLNVSAYNAEADTLSPFTVSTEFDYYAMKEGGVFTKPFNYEKPMQIDIIVKSTGPKVLKFDWLTDNPAAVMYMHFLTAPSGKTVDYYEAPAVFQGVNTLYNYLIFTANEIGAYRLLVAAQYANPASLNLEFLDIDISSLPLNTAQFGGNFDDFGTLDVSKTAMWQSNWYRISGKKGDLFRLDIYQDFSTGFTPTIEIWSPSANGYFYQTVGTGTHDIYFAKNGYAYVSLTDVNFEDWYRYSLLLTKANNEKYTLGDKTTFSINMDETKTVEFTLSSDAIVRFNYTSLPNPAGSPALNSLGNANAFIFRDSAEFQGYVINFPLLTRTVGSTTFRWHYMPRGTYKGVIRNTNPLANGLFQISSQVYGWSDDSIPVNNMIYPASYPKENVTIEFEQDPEIISLKNPLGIDIEIPDIGQFRLNTTIRADDNVDIAASFSPSHFYTFNDTDLGYYHFGYPQPIFSTDGIDNTLDYFYIGAPTRWTGMTFDFLTPGNAGTFEAEVYDGGWPVLSWDNDGTSQLSADGTIEFDISDVDFDDWIKGTGGLDLDPNVTETDYYWMRLDWLSGYSTIPILQELTLLNSTIRGDLQYILIGESGYQYDDYWGPSGITQPSDLTNLELSLDDDDGGVYNTESYVASIIRGSDPLTVGYEGGTYKLLVIPEQWDYNGSLNVHFAVENYWGYAHTATYDILDLPKLHAIEITNYTLAGYSNLTSSVPYDYGLVTEYNHTETALPFGGDESYFALECTGEPYQWTQLVLTFQGVADFEIYLLQDLPWIGTTGPNAENQLLASTVNTNRTLEFGVFSETFTLLFEVADSAENITFYVSLSQYNTLMLTTSNVKASYTPPLSDAAILALAIGIPAAAGAVVVIYVLKKKGKILTKRPS